MTFYPIIFTLSFALFPVYHNPIKPVEPVKTVKEIVINGNIHDRSGAYIKIQKEVRNETVSRHLLRSCRTTKNQKHCINIAMWFAGIESSMFKTCKKNNCFWMRELVRPEWGKPYYRVIWFNTVKEGIDYWVENFYKPHLSKIKTAKDAINCGYCSGDCSNPGSTWSKIIWRFIWYIK